MTCQIFSAEMLCRLGIHLFRGFVDVGRNSRGLAFVWEGRKSCLISSHHTKRCEQLIIVQVQFYSTQQKPSYKVVVESKEFKARKFNAAMYGFGTAIFFFGLTYLAVPGYRMFCQATSTGGSVRGKHFVDQDKIETMSVVKKRLLKIRFEADTSAQMAWNFKPLQREIWLHPGETALAFYTAKNPTTKPVIGISTYNVVPYEAGMYFSKIQCFCFEEQILNPGEELDMPVFFYIDPDFAADPAMEFVDEIVLGYTFFDTNQDKRPVAH